MKKLSSINEVVNINGHVISYYDISSCRTVHPKGAYIVIHGALGNSETTVDFAVFLAERVQEHAVLLVDLPGHGNSKGEPLTTIKEIARVITDFVRTVQDSHKYEEVYLVGHSMGGSVVLQMLADGFNAQKAAILMSSPEWSSMEAMFGIQEEQISDAFIQMMTYEFDQLRDREQYIARIPHMAADSKASIADIQALSTFNILPEVDQIKAPLLIVASEHDETASIESIEALASKLTDYGSHIVMGGTHTSVISHAEEVADVVAKF